LNYHRPSGEIPAIAMADLTVRFDFGSFSWLLLFEEKEVTRHWAK